MKLAAGTRLGPYAIEHPIGAGGMGVVYRADDSRLGRKVAIKILPNANVDQFRRFEREARAIGGLNHPNLLTLFDVGTHDGVPFLVTEMLEGESLRSRLSRGALKLREAVKIAAEVAHGLAAAHDAGVVHRDVKPDNVFLTTSGRTKILDFGIAKLRRATVEQPAVVDPLQDTPVPTTADTGVVIGTPGYMAPEQLDAGTIDERTDIFSLGVVLYEMICGKRAFISDSAVEESYAILKTTPDPPKGATKAVARVVLRCLEKRKDARFQSARDLAFALDELDASTDPVQRISRLPGDLDAPNAPTIRDPDPPMMSEPRPWRRWLALAGLATIAGVLGGILIGRATAHAHERWPTLVEGGPSYQRVTYHAQSKWSARLSRDGASVLYSAQHGDRDIVLRSSVAQPSISPTAIAGRLVDVSRRGEIAILSEEGSEGGTLARAFEGAGLRQVLDHVTDAAFLPDDTLAVVRRGFTIEYPIGTVIAKRTTGRLDILRASPTGDRFAFVDHPASADTSGIVMVIDAAGHELIKSSLQNEVEGVAWSPDGKEVWFSNASTIFALERDGGQHVILRNFDRLVLLDIKAGKILVAPSDQRLKMFTGPRTLAPREVGWFDSSEVEAVSTDGAVVAFVEATGTGQTAEGYQHFMRRGDEPATPIGHGFRLAMLPDTTASIVIASPSLLQRVPTGIGTPTPIPLGKLATLDISDRIAISWSGRFVVVRGAEAGAAMHLWRIDLEHPGPEPVAPAYVDGQHPISSDGATIAIARSAGGLELVGPAGVRELPGPPGETPLSFSGDDAALFAMHLVKSTIEIERIEIATGVRSPWGSITPEQKPFYYKVVLDAAGNIITYSTNSDASDLYVIEPTVTTLLVTGATDGLGQGVVRALAAHNTTLLVHGRDAARTDALAAELRRTGATVRCYLADLASLAEVRAMAAAILAHETRLDVLINNAGIGSSVPTRERAESRDGIELRFAVNYLSHYLLTRELLPLLLASAPARIVNIASIGQAAIDFADPMITRDYSGGRAYRQSKLAQILSTFDLAEELRGTGVTVTALHPATFMPTKIVATPTSTLQEGIDAVLHLALEATGVTGVFFDGQNEARADPQAYDPAARVALRALSETLVSSPPAGART